MTALPVPPRRIVNLIGFVVCAGLIGYALYLQHGAGLEPCPLCVLQRLAVAATGLVFLLAAVHQPRRTGASIYAGMLALTTGAGVAVAGRHVWLQSLPPEQVPEACGASLEYMLDVFSLSEVFDKVFYGAGECANVDWSFLGLSMPAWVLVWLVVLGLAGLLVNTAPQH